MSGRKISDHASWMGSSSKESPLPMGSKMKSESSAEGDGHIGTMYPDTTEKIKADQMKGVQKMKAHKIKEGYRN